MRVTYSASEGNELPFGADRFVLAGIQHLAIQQDSPIVLFDRVGTILKKFGLNEAGSTISLLRKRFVRLSGLSIRILFASTQEQLLDQAHGEQHFIIKRFSLPTREDLRSERAGQLEIPGSHRFGVVLENGFWEHLSETKNHLLLPLELLKLYFDKPTGWDYLCVLTARCGSAQRTSKVPHEALVSLFRDTKQQSDRHIIHNIKRYHREIQQVTGVRLNAEIIEDV